MWICVLLACSGTPDADKPPSDTTAATSPGPADTTDVTSPSDADADTDADTDTDADSDTDADTDSDTDADADTAPPVDPRCPLFSAPTVLGTLPDDLNELSGLAPSHNAPGHWWAHEDSGTSATLHLLDPTGARVATWDVAGSAVDWEDIALVVDPASGAPTLYIGDIGDNPRTRPSVAVHVVPEPADPLAGGDLVPVTHTLTYPDGPHDSEALVVDPSTGDIVLVTKSLYGDTGLYVVRGEALEKVAELDFGVPPLTGLATTGADWSADGRWLVIRTYLPEAYLWPVPADAGLAAAVAAPPCPVPLAEEPQGEAIAFTADSAALVHASEGGGQTIYRVDLSD
ncbi:MAG: hypothetical protein ACI9K2_002675 [Myxococcota bacterium]|jgi:hypothetical protein